MRPDVKVAITVGTLRAMTPAQFNALRDNVLADGLWETQTEPIRVAGTDPLGVEVGGMFIGIEHDGYTHS